MTETPKRLSKENIIKRWEDLEEGAIRVTPIPEGHRGSNFASDTIRITGSQEFIDSVLGNLKGFLDRDNGSTRLQVIYSQSVDRENQELTGAWTCYIQVHARGTKKRGRPAKGDRPPATLKIKVPPHAAPLFHGFALAFPYEEDGITYYDWAVPDISGGEMYATREEAEDELAAFVRTTGAKHPPEIVPVQVVNGKLKVDK